MFTEGATVCVFKIRLFGKFSAQHNDCEMGPLPSVKAKEVLCYVAIEKVLSADLVATSAGAG